MLAHHIQRVLNANWQVYGADNVRLHMNREGLTVAHCNVERLMKSVRLQGVRRGKVVRTTHRRSPSAMPAGPRQPGVQGAALQPAVGVGL